MILALGIILGAALTVFTIENAGYVTVNMLSWQLTAPMAFVLVGVIAVSAFAVLLAFIPTLMKLESDIRKLSAQRKVLEQELAKYQITIPIAPPAPGARAFVVTEEPTTVYSS